MSEMMPSGAKKMMLVSAVLGPIMPAVMVKYGLSSTYHLICPGLVFHTTA